ncbi:MAG: alpha-hydroxy-acid oxidizing protein [Nitrospinae bacterium]|nr:alpha-hydroxy-acid oxidizing protein [Nitrospinota bacterium]
MSLDFVSNEEIIQEARRRLDQGAWDYLVGGSESETTLRRNRLAFDRIAFRPRILVDVSHIDPSTTFMGQPLRIPAILAPIGSLQVFHPQGAVAATRAATEFGIMHAVSSVTQPPLEETAAATSTPKIFQLYVHGDMQWTKDLLGRVKQAGYAALALTVDVAHYSRRERPMRTRYQPPTRRAPPDRRYQASLTWETMDSIREMAGLPFLLKGVQTAEDAEIAVQHGVDVIWVSNHGGRQIDHGLGSMDILPEIVQAVNGRARIMVDGAVQRGSDILKAVALGADVVALGRLQGWGLAAGGEAGVVRMLEILEDELISAMGLMGVTSIGQVTPKYVCKAEPVTPPHEMSAWVNMLVGRIL